MVLLITGLLHFERRIQLFEHAEDRIIDFWFLLRNDQQAISPDIVIVYLDDESLLDYGYRSPVPRPLLSDLIETLSQMDASVIGVDVLLDRSYNSADDKQLLQTLGEHGKQVVLVSQRKEMRRINGNSVVIDSFARKAAAVGYGEVQAGKDGVVRWVLLGRHDSQYSFSEEIVKKHLGVLPSIPFKQETQSSKPIRIDFPGPADTLLDKQPKFSTITAREVKFADPRLFKNRIVLIGAGVAGTSDRYPTPFSSPSNNFQKTSGIEIQATVVNMLLLQNWLLDISSRSYVVLFFLMLLLVSLSLTILQPPYNLILPLLLIPALPIASALIFLVWGLILPFLKLEAGLILTVLILLAILHREALKQNRLLQYLASLVEQSLTKSRREIRNLSAHQLESIENERKRIARELHDEMGQTLASIKLDLAYIDRHYNPEDSEFRNRTWSMIERINAGLGSIREIISDIRPKVLDDLGIVAAVEWLVSDFDKKSGIFCRLRLQPEEFDLPSGLATDCYRLVQEMLTNVLKHAGATMVRVSILKTDHLTIQVTDNGIGYLEEKTGKEASYGILGMRERVMQYQGYLEVRGLKDIGTTFKITIPLRLEGEKGE